MANIRAYRLAAELGIEKADFVEQAKLVGIELRSPMAALDEEQAQTLREKLGGAERAKKDMDESRVEAKGGRTVLDRKSVV